MESEINDQQLLRLFDEQKLKMPANKCPSGHRVSWMCTNPNCKISLHCSDEDCSCADQHSKCKVLRLKGIVNEINEKVEGYRDIVLKVLQCDLLLITAIRESQKEFIRKCQFRSFAYKHQKIIDLLTVGKQGNISGLEALEFEGAIKSSANSVDVSVERTNWYKDQVLAVGKTIALMKEQLLEKKEVEKGPLKGYKGKAEIGKQEKRQVQVQGQGFQHLANGVSLLKDKQNVHCLTVIDNGCYFQYEQGSAVMYESKQKYLEKNIPLFTSNLLKLPSLRKLIFRMNYPLSRYCCFSSLANGITELTLLKQIQIFIPDQFRPYEKSNHWADELVVPKKIHYV